MMKSSRDVGKEEPPKDRIVGLIKELVNKGLLLFFCHEETEIVVTIKCIWKLRQNLANFRLFYILLEINTGSRLLVN